MVEEAWVDKEPDSLLVKEGNGGFENTLGDEIHDSFLFRLLAH